MNTDGGGTLDEKEVKNAFSKLGLYLTDTEVDVLFDENDPDRNGIDFHEFRKMVGGASVRVREIENRDGKRQRE